MQAQKRWRQCFLFCAFLYSFLLTGCANQMSQSDQDDPNLALSGRSAGLPLYQGRAPYTNAFNEDKYVSELPQSIPPSNEKVIIVDPKIFAWGAYDENGQLVRGGMASAGAEYCPDKKGPCRTTVGTFRIYSLGDADCISRTYPLPKGGSLMPYCMFFHNGESLHGSPDPMLVERNISHGCIHMRIPDAEWLRYDFASLGTKVVILPY